MNSALFHIELVGQDRNGNFESAGQANGGYAYHTRALAEKLADRIGGTRGDAVVVGANDEGIRIIHAWSMAETGHFGPVRESAAVAEDALFFDDIPF